MPVRIQGRLLAELGAVLGLCLAAAGCQTSVVRSEPSGPSQGQIVSIMRPVAVEGNSTQVSSSSGYYAIQRTSGEQMEPMPASQGQALGNTPTALTLDNQFQQQPNEQLNQPQPLTPQPVIEMNGPGMHSYSYGMSAPREFDKHSYPLYIIEPPDILLIQSTKGLLDQPVQITSPVGMDGMVNLGTYGQVFLAGLTIDQAREAVAAQLGKRVKNLDVLSVSVQVAAYNSKVYYVITDGGGYGATVARFPATGNETVLDALAQIGGLPAVASMKHIWLARATPADAAHPQIMPIDWVGVTQHASAATNYQIFPGDRIYVSSDPWVRKDTWLARRLAPINQLLGTVLLGSTTVNSVKGKTSSGAP